MGEIEKYSDDLARLAELAVSESIEDVRLFLGKVARKYKAADPTLAERISAALRAANNGQSGRNVLRREGPRPIEVFQKSETHPLLKQFDDRGGLEKPLLSSALYAQIERIVGERKQRDRLLKHGLRPTKSAILVGPPGVGKTLSARWIASQLQQPLLVLDLTAVMSSLLGKTGTNLRSALDYAKDRNAVLLLDEIDAIAKRRNDESDIGELKRLVAGILQEVDQWPDSSLLLAATNHPELVDPALWRRFDAVLHFDSADDEAVRKAIDRFLGSDINRFKPWQALLMAALKSHSLSDVERAISSLRRRAVMEEGPLADLVMEASAESIRTLDRAQRTALAIEMAKAGCAHHAVRRITGVARDTLRSRAGPSKRRGGVQK